MTTDVSGRDFEHYQGTTRTLDVTIVDIDGNPVDLSSITAIEWRMATTAWSTTAAVSKSLGDGISVADETAGLIAIHLLPADTESLPCRRYYHECRIAEDVNITKVFTGHVTLLRDLI